MTKILYYTATWCGSCRALTPQLEQIKSKYPNISIENRDIDLNPNDVVNKKLKSIPTFIVEKNGQEIERLISSNISKIETLFKNN